MIASRNLRVCTGRLPLPAGGDRVCGALVAALRIVVRDVEELLAERGINVDHVSVYRWVQTFTAEFIDAARTARHATGSSWFVDETYVRSSPLDLPVPRGRSARSRDRRPGLRTRRRRGRVGVLRPGATHGVSPVEITTDRAPVYPRVLDELAPASRHVWEQMRTTAWKLITADSRLGCDRCAD